MRAVVGTEELYWRSMLSGLWIYFLLNILFRDIHEFLRTGYIEQVISGTVYGNKITEEILLVSAIVLQIPLLMTVLTLVMNARLTRWLNILAAGIMFVSISAFIQQPDMDDIAFAVFEGIALVAIVVIAWIGSHSKTIGN